MYFNRYKCVSTSCSSEFFKRRFAFSLRDLTATYEATFSIACYVLAEEAEVKSGMDSDEHVQVVFTHASSVACLIFK